MTQENYEDEDEPHIIDEILFKKVLNKDELDVIFSDENFLYCVTKNQLPNIFSDIFDYKPITTSEKKDNIKRDLITFHIEMPKKLFIYKPRNIIIPTYKFDRKLSSFSEGKKEEIDILLLVKYYTKLLSLKDLLDRTDKLTQNEWDKLHKNKEITYVC